MVHEPFARLISRLNNHVHSLSVAGEVAEIEDHFSSDCMTLHALQLAVARGGFRLGANRFELVGESNDELMRLFDILEEEHRRNAILVYVDTSSDSTCTSQCNHPTFIGANQSS